MKALLFLWMQGNEQKEQKALTCLQLLEAEIEEDSHRRGISLLERHVPMSTLDRTKLRMSVVSAVKKKKRQLMSNILKSKQNEN
ncbi:hypothetical protein TNCT_677221 [Trichonephila clavata]|uniref:Uncharacterized protein n=1 Tax=Trichonephila clavata TaxID=2740835 RepID=A0A8X6HJ14_TRICU|nr:hypothetical protein TNCT_677221 [Trichonephila clavata]